LHKYKKYIVYLDRINKKLGKNAEEINANWDKIKNLKKNRFNEWAPLYLYLNVTEAKGRMIFCLRYLGQDVAKLKVTPGKITISTKGFEEKNEKYFGCKISLRDSEWTSSDATNFRRHFSIHPNAANVGKSNNEHRIESLFLINFAKKSSKRPVFCAYNCFHEYFSCNLFFFIMLHSYD